MVTVITVVVALQNTVVFGFAGAFPIPTRRTGFGHLKSVPKSLSLNWVGRSEFRKPSSLRVGCPLGLVAPHPDEVLIPTVSAPRSASRSPPPLPRNEFPCPAPSCYDRNIFMAATPLPAPVFASAPALAALVVSRHRPSHRPHRPPLPPRAPPHRPHHPALHPPQPRPPPFRAPDGSPRRRPPPRSPAPSAGEPRAARRSNPPPAAPGSPAAMAGSSASSATKSPPMPRNWKPCSPSPPPPSCSPRFPPPAASFTRSAGSSASSPARPAAAPFAPIAPRAVVRAGTPFIATPAPRSGPFPYYPSADWPTHSRPPPKRA